MITACRTVAETAHLAPDRNTLLRQPHRWISSPKRKRRNKALREEKVLIARFSPSKRFSLSARRHARFCRGHGACYGNGSTRAHEHTSTPRASRQHRENGKPGRADGSLVKSTSEDIPLGRTISSAMFATCCVLRRRVCVPFRDLHSTICHYRYLPCSTVFTLIDHTWNENVRSAPT